jgi:hypothetical protein
MSSAPTTTEGPGSTPPPRARTRSPSTPVATPFARALAGHARAFRGPVLLLNGDSHEFTDDHPLADPVRPYHKSMYGITSDVPNLRRITVNGSTEPCHEWLKLTIDRRAAGLFSIQRVRFHNQPGFDPVVCPPSQGG